MKFAKLPCLILSGLLLMAGVAHARDIVAPSDNVKASTETRKTESASRQKLLQDAGNLIKSGKAEEAYALLEPEQSNRAGDPEYDYLLGLAALDSGKPTQAIFALERVLAVQPNHLQARAEIARAYFATGEKAAAKQEFESVQRQNPPKEVNATIQKFLDAINQGQVGKSTILGGYLDVSIGNDSNVNSATANNQVAIPVFGGAIATLNANGVETSDSFATVSGGANVRHFLSSDWQVFGGANINQRKNSTESDFNTGGMDGNVGLILTKAEDSYSAALQLQSFSIDGERYRNGTGMTLQWQRDLKSNNQASSYFQYTDLKYPDQSVRDAKRYVLGAAYAGMMGGDYAPAVYAGLYAGQEKEKQADVPYLGHKFYGVRAGGEMSIYAQTRLFGSLSVESRSYGGDDPFFLVDRKDTQSDLKLGINYAMTKYWSLTPQLGYTKNKSNIVINDYKRSIVSVGLRRDFY
ncbi:MAG: surface lipoprotein assembly modifier [Sideroxyarcus sp.]|nr:surface lipoprotein assembly modifier [Sideroxyarcus sp.]